MGSSLPWSGNAGLPAGVSDLHAGNGAVLLQEAGDPGESRHMVVEVDAAIRRADTAFRRHRRRFDDDQAGPAHGARAEMHEMPVGGKAIVRRVLAHWRDDNA